MVLYTASWATGGERSFVNFATAGIDHRTLPGFSLTPSVRFNTAKISSDDCDRELRRDPAGLSSSPSRLTLGCYFSRCAQYS